MTKYIYLVFLISLASCQSDQIISPQRLIGVNDTNMDDHCRSYNPTNTDSVFVVGSRIYWHKSTGNPNRFFSVDVNSLILRVNNNVTGNKLAPTVTTTPPSITFVEPQNMATCFKSCDDLITNTASPSGGIPPFNYNWVASDGQTSTSQSFSFTCTDIGTIAVNVTVTDSNGCTFTDFNDIIVEGCPTPTMTLTDLGGCILVVTGGTQGPECNNPDIEISCDLGITWSTYEASVGIGDIFSITQDCCFRLNFEACGDNCCVWEDVCFTGQGCDVGCNGAVAASYNACDGDYSLLCVGGTWEFQYENNGNWITDQTGTATATTLTLTAPFDGNWRLLITCTDGCVYISTEHIFSGCGAPPCNLTSTINESPSCQLNAIPSSGTPPYSYIWSNGSTNQSINVTTDATFTVTVTDNAACTSISSYTTTGCTTICDCTPTATCDQSNQEIDYSVTGNCIGYNWVLQFSLTGTGWSSVDNGSGNVSNSFPISQTGFYRLVLTDTIVACPGQTTPQVFCCVDPNFSVIYATCQINTAVGALCSTYYDRFDLDVGSDCMGPEQFTLSSNENMTYSISFNSTGTLTSIISSTVNSVVIEYDFIGPFADPPPCTPIAVHDGHFEVTATDDCGISRVILLMMFEN